MSALNQKAWVAESADDQSGDFAQDFGSGLERPLNASTSLDMAGSIVRERS
jgi:hypothetical protein